MRSLCYERLFFNESLQTCLRDVETSKVQNFALYLINKQSQCALVQLIINFTCIFNSFTNFVPPAIFKKLNSDFYKSKSDFYNMARNFGHFRAETSCGLHEGFIYTAGIHGKVRADPTN